MKSLALALLLIPSAAFSGPWYELVNGTMSLTGVLGIASSSTTPKNYVLQLNGPGGYIQFPDGSKATSACTSGTCEKGDTGATGAQGPQGIQGIPGDPAGNTFASSVTITGASGGYGLSVSSNVYIVGYSSASAYYGDGSHLTGLAGGGDVFKASTQTLTGSNTFTATGTGSTVISSATITTAVIPTITGNTSIRGHLLPNYDSGWFPVTVGTTYTVTHNLGTIDFSNIMVMNRKSDGTIEPNLFFCAVGRNSIDYAYGTLFYISDANTFKVTPLDSDVNGIRWYQMRVKVWE